MTDTSFPDAVEAQFDLLQNGEPLEALDQFFAAEGRMYSNDQLFAHGIRQAREKQERYILAAQSISGQIEDLRLLTDKQVCMFRNRTSFTSSDGNTHQIDGLCWQQWEDSKIVVERYFDGALMKAHISAGVLDDPSCLPGLPT